MPSTACRVTAAASASADVSDAPSPQRARDVGGVQQREQPHRIGHHAVIELHRQRVLEHVAPRRRQEEQARAVGHQAAVDQRPGIVDQAGAQAGDQRAEIDLHDHETEQHQRARADAARRGDRRARDQVLRGPEHGGEDDAGQRQVERQPILRHADAVAQPGGDHPPADRAERGAEEEDGQQPGAQVRLDLAAPQEPEQRKQEHGADQPRQHAMRPLPPVDRLEIREAHSRIAFAVLRNGLVLVELDLPGPLVERRQDAGDRLPLDDREARTR